MVSQPSSGGSRRNRLCDRSSTCAYGRCVWFSHVRYSIALRRRHAFGYRAVYSTCLQARQLLHGASQLLNLVVRRRQLAQRGQPKRRRRHAGQRVVGDTQKLERPGGVFEISAIGVQGVRKVVCMLRGARGCIAGACGCLGCVQQPLLGRCAAWSV